LRSVFFINKKYFIILDQLENKNPIKHQWLLHSKVQFTERQSENEIESAKNNAGLFVKFIFPKKGELKFSQTDQFIVPIDDAYIKKYKNDWHFKADTLKAEKKREFISLLYPFKKDAKESIKSEFILSGKGFLISCKTGTSDDKIFLAKENEKLVISDFGFLKGIAGAVSKDRVSTNFVLVEGTDLKSGDFSISSSVTASLDGTISKDKLLLSVKSSGKTEIKIRIDFIPKNIEGISSNNFLFDEKSKTVVFNIVKDANIVLSE
jgi:hypothetical protein